MMEEEILVFWVQVNVTGLAAQNMINLPLKIPKQMHHGVPRDDLNSRLENERCTFL